MNVQEKISIHRVIPIVGIIISAIVSSCVLAVINKIEIGGAICVFFVNLGFIPVMIFELVYERNRKEIASNTQTTYARIALGFFICSILMVVVSFLPEFFRPYMLFVLIMLAFSNETIGITSALFFLALLAMSTGASYNELLTGVLLTIIGYSLAKALKKKELRIYIGILFGLTNIIFPCVFYYLTNENIPFTTLIYSGINAVIIALYTILLYPKNKEVTETEIKFFYDEILGDDYSLVREVRNYSMSEFIHARKVSEIAYKYANKLSLDADLASAAGFYYRLGHWQGEPFVLNGVEKGKEMCFPEELIQILREYNGEEELPSTPESALVHIIDGVCIKLELFGNEVGTSQWNRDIVIYQTLDEFSATGLYDKSGLSINMFLKIRELIAKEDLLK